MARELTDGTLDNIQGSIRRFRAWVQHDGLDQLDRKTLREYRSFIAMRASGLYANDEVGRLLTWWQWLDDEGWDVARSPRSLRLPRAAPRLEPYAPTWAEMDAAVRATAGTWYQRLIILERCTGLRSMMLLHLKWCHVDLERSELAIPPRHPGSKVVAMHRGRVLPMAPVLVEEMAGWGRREGWVVDRTIARRRIRQLDPDRREMNHHQLRRYLHAATPPIDPRAVRQPTHAFRKGFITGLTRAGVDGSVRRYLVGHKGASTHDDVYTVWAQLEGVTRAAVAHVPPVDHEGPVVLIREGDQRISSGGLRWTAVEVHEDVVVAMSSRGRPFTFSRERWTRMAL
jgi:integrase